jgi:hypothetical protein
MFRQMELAMTNDTGYLANISEGFSSVAGGNELSLLVIITMVAGAMLWSAHFHHKRRDLSPYEQL